MIPNFKDLYSLPIDKNHTLFNIGPILASNPQFFSIKYDDIVQDKELKPLADKLPEIYNASAKSIFEMWYALSIVAASSDITNDVSYIYSNYNLYKNEPSRIDNLRMRLYTIFSSKNKIVLPHFMGGLTVSKTYLLSKILYKLFQIIVKRNLHFSNELDKNQSNPWIIDFQNVGLLRDSYWGYNSKKESNSVFSRLFKLAYLEKKLTSNLESKEQEILETNYVSFNTKLNVNIHDLLGSI